MPFPTLLTALPWLILVPLIPLALAFIFLLFLLPAPSSSLYSAHENRHSFFDDQKTLRPSTPTPITCPSGKGILAVLGPSLAAALVFGGAATIGYVGLACGESDGGALTRLAGVLMVFGTALAGAAPIVLFTPAALGVVFPSCATAYPGPARASPVRPTPPVPYKLTRSRYRIPFLTLALTFSCLWTLLTTLLAPSLPLPLAARAIPPVVLSLALLLPIPSIFLLASHRPIFLLVVISQFFGVTAPTFAFAQQFATEEDVTVLALRIVQSAFQLLWVGSVLVCTFALSTTPQPPLMPPVPAYLPNPVGSAFLQAPSYGSKPRATPSPLGIRSSPVPSTRTASVIDIGPFTVPADSDEMEMEMDNEKAFAAYDVEVVELRDPTALLRAAILRSFPSSNSAPSSPSLTGSGIDVSITSSTRAALEAAFTGGDFTLGMPYTPPMPQQTFPAPPPAAKPARRPKTSASLSLRQTLSRLRLAPRPATAPSAPIPRPPTPPSPAHPRNPLCRDENCTCEMGYAYEGFPPRMGPGSPQTQMTRGTTRESGRSWSWVGELEAEGFAGIERGVVGRRPEGVQVEVEGESDGEGRKGMEIERA